jgi:hypothetical protein
MKSTEKIAGYNWTITTETYGNCTAWCDRLGIKVSAASHDKLKEEIKLIVYAIENDKDL